ncbi:WbqC family protein [Streptantibioticus ferralitis]|uniref:WbqC family protein n=1 Tax=Streptantibioticus ferralitis TaxID=236510 RepID=A0ABT5Z100_9ACTN|nr:WbqC family protein [Streptantibioticus ferralitis]MDF2257312.1 WbqC family protein [Streptantibioticus ferralitis]
MSGLCAIHQPNLFPRLTTLAKLFAADYWIVLDDVQFSRRDYQHRIRLTASNDPQWRQWLTIPTHLPRGRATAIHEALIVDPIRSRRRVAQMLRYYYRASRHWAILSRALEPFLDLFTTTDKTADISEASTRILLELLGWHGRILRSSQLSARSGRSQRLADLAVATGACGYLCGTGGMRYLEANVFTALGIAVIPFRTPTTGLWHAGREISAIRSLMTCGVRVLADELRDVVANQEVTQPLRETALRDRLPSGRRPLGTSAFSGY